MTSVIIPMADIIIENLTKNYGSFVALDNVSLRSNSGEVFGLLGPNGAGKSTLMKTVVGILKPTSGRVKLNGYDIVQDPEKAKKITGYLPENPSLYAGLTTQEFLQFVGKIRGVNNGQLDGKITESLKTFGLEEKKNSLVGSLSKGMKQKVAIIAATIHDPQILVLDEPLSGLDPRSQKFINDWLKSLTKSNITTLLSTHNLDVAASYTTKIAIIDRGKIIAAGEIEALRKMADANTSAGLDEIFLRLTEETSQQQ
jgi:ABC-type multidrug transport system ATPase subunit